jgi:hypothetical protein
LTVCPETERVALIENEEETPKTEGVKEVQVAVIEKLLEVVVAPTASSVKIT